MPQIRFEDLTQSLLRVPDVIRSIPDVIANPASNPLQAAILLGIVLVLLLIVLFSVLLIVMRPSRVDKDLFGEAAGTTVSAAEQGRPFSWLTVTGIVVLVIALLWVVTGVTSTGSEVCTSCHIDTPHSVAVKGGDPHSGVVCVSCHETGGAVARATANLPIRVQHFILGRTTALQARGYGRPVASDACLRCHQDQIQGVVVDRTTGVRVSHKEPLAAGAQCVDCHILAAGVIGATTAGMAPCLRCHDGTIAKADCEVCHVGDPSDAIRSRATTSMAGIQVPNPQCNSCHFDMTTCNACHGISMPHSTDFMVYGHARAGAVDIWNNNLRVCRKCHYPGHNDCQQSGCHAGPFPSHPSPAWKTLHGYTAWPAPNATVCQCHGWNPYDHNGVLFCQICHPVKPKNARP